jgi:hypothetical protein
MPDSRLPAAKIGDIQPLGSALESLDLYSMTAVFTAYGAVEVFSSRPFSWQAGKTASSTAAPKTGWTATAARSALPLLS